MYDLLAGINYKKAFYKCRNLNKIIIFLNFDQKEVIESRKTMGNKNA